MATNATWTTCQPSDEPRPIGPLGHALAIFWVWLTFSFSLAMFLHNVVRASLRLYVVVLQEDTSNKVTPAEFSGTVCISLDKKSPRGRSRSLFIDATYSTAPVLASFLTLHELTCLARSNVSARGLFGISADDIWTRREEEVYNHLLWSKGFWKRFVVLCARKFITSNFTIHVTSTSLHAYFRQEDPTFLCRPIYIQFSAGKDCNEGLQTMRTFVRLARPNCVSRWNAVLSFQEVGLWPLEFPSTGVVTRFTNIARCQQAARDIKRIRAQPTPLTPVSKPRTALEIFHYHLVFVYLAGVILGLFAFGFGTFIWLDQEAALTSWKELLVGQFYASVLILGECAITKIIRVVIAQDTGFRRGLGFCVICGFLFRLMGVLVRKSYTSQSSYLGLVCDGVAMLRGLSFVLTAQVAARNTEKREISVLFCIFTALQFSIASIGAALLFLVNDYLWLRVRTRRSQHYAFILAVGTSSLSFMALCTYEPFFGWLASRAFIHSEIWIFSVLEILLEHDRTQTAMSPWLSAPAILLCLASVVECNSATYVVRSLCTSIWLLSYIRFACLAR